SRRSSRGDLMETNLARPARALAIGAHPDDIEFGCGATLAKWASAGTEIFHLVCTDGSKGTWDPDQDPAELVAARHLEQKAAARALGGSGEVAFLDHVDGELGSSMAERREVAGWIRRLRPEVVFGHDPWKRYRLHPDHRNAGFLATDGIVAARDPLFFPALDVAPHRPHTLLLWEADDVNHVEDVTGFVTEKLAALLEHRSQLRSTMGISSAGTDLDGGSGENREKHEHREVAAFKQKVTERLAENGAAQGFGAAETFHKITPL
ncbi:MAG: PIG-L deacetylase family protein, partial [Acidimicrobiales bacterium]